MFFTFFFFSSRRRHTRFDCDWSSDVCSSDLAERFADRARDAGVDGVLVLDLPIEEADDFRNMLAVRGIDTILLLSPTTTDERLRRAAALGSGFLYAISRLGVTGARDRIADGAHEMVDRIRRVSDLPVDRKSTRLNSSHSQISYAVFC